MDYSVALLIFGILLLLVGLAGKVKAKELEVGTSSPFVRVIVGSIGVLFVGLSLFISPAKDYLPDLSNMLAVDKSTPVPLDTEQDSQTADNEPAPPVPVQPTPVADTPWFVFLGAFPHADYASVQDLKSKLDSSLSQEMVILNTDDYSNLKDGLYALAISSGTRAEAEAIRESVLQLVPEAYVKSGGDVKTN